ncbi:LLM class flavin-dependent oxidoreductase [Phenylobacterium hankyongense]|uniref:Luciferase-like monooxygenase n=1 Tax=Phenylobacterium hankyongense TaxID=1813876 RepID=A0A328B358_9CAUL|nr:LLM class flavin-dependent oxidoreductase [Phenylobacterium hankyongense]RAK61872.1 LLM class flavin-dependent oxidoreductase [Phenylobacterium hankyongense]
MVPLSVLDLSPILQGSNATQSLRNSRDLAQHAERLGFHRYWLAEHHNMPGIASAATSVVIGYVAEGTSTIRVGAGGVMLPNHAPLVIAEQFGTLEALYPGRIDLGLGRAPGTDQITARALRRTLVGDVDRFPQDVLELMAYFQEPQPGQAVRAYPGAGLKVPVWILGSSTYGAQLAAALGLPYAFASHFAPAQMEEAIALYRARFEPSEQLDKPCVMLGLNVVAAETDAEAKRLFTSLQQAFLNLRTGHPSPLPPPVDDIDARFAAAGMSPGMQGALASAVVGAPETVRRGLDDFVRRHQPDEIIVTAQIYDHAARVRSFEIVAAARDQLAKAA